MIASDDELLIDWLQRLEELSSTAGDADLESLISLDAQLRRQMDDRPDLWRPLQQRYAALRTIDRYVKRARVRPFRRSAHH